MAVAKAIIDIDINTSAASAALKQFQLQINAFQTSLNRGNIVQAAAAAEYSRSLSDLVNTSKYFAAESVRMRTSAAQLDDTLKKGKTSVGQYFNALKKGTAEYAAVTSLANARASALQTQFVATGAAAGGYREALAIRPLQAFNTTAAVTAERLAIQRAMFAQATTSLINFGKNTQWAGRQLMVGFTVPLTIFGTLAGKTFMDLEKAAISFKKVYGDAFTTPEELQTNLDAVKKLSVEFTKYGIAAKDTMEMAAQAAAAGNQNAALIDATTEATRLATLGQMEQAKALEATISLQNAFGLSGEKLTKSINFMNMVENQTVLTLQDMADAIPRVAPVIKGLGGNVEDLAAMLAAMKEGGVSAAQGANAIKSGLASLINPTTRATESLQAMGINLKAIIDRNKGDLMGTVQSFATELAKLDTLSQQRVLEQVFGKYQYARLGALFKNIVKDGTQASRVLEMTGTSAQQMAAVAEKELGVIAESPATKLTAAIERLKIAVAPVGEMFVKIATPVIELFTKLLGIFNNLPDGVKQIGAIGTIIVGVLVPAGTMFLGLLMNLVGTLLKFGNVLNLAFKGFASGGIRGAIESVSQAFKYMSLAEIDTATAAKQLGTATDIANAALIEQVGAAGGATAAIDTLAGAYARLIVRMEEAAALSGAFATPGAAMQTAGRRPIRVVRRNKGGSIPYFGTGGQSTVPGVGNTDTVPAMLTPGEFVVNKKATAENLPLLHAINGGDVKGFNKGGGVAQSGRTFYGVRPPNPRLDPRLLKEGEILEQELQKQISEGLALGFGIPLSQASQLATRRVTGQIGERAHLDSLFVSPEQAKAVLSLRPDNARAAAAAEIAQAFIRGGMDSPVGGLTTNWATVTRKLNQAANRGENEIINIGQAVGELVEGKKSLFKREVGPALSLAEITPDSFVDIVVGKLKTMDQSAIFSDVAFSNAFKLAISDLGKQVTPKLTGLRIPTKIDLREIISRATGIPTAAITDDVIRTELSKIGINYEPGKHGIINVKGSSFVARTGESTPFVFKDINAGISLNSGGMIPGVQYFGWNPAAGILNRQRVVQDQKFMPARMMWQSKDINQALAKMKQGYSLGNLPHPTGIMLADDISNAIDRGVHPMGMMYDIALQAGYSKEKAAEIMNNMSRKLINEFGILGDSKISLQQYETITDNVQKQFLSQLERETIIDGKTKTLNLYDELNRIGFLRGGTRGRRIGKPKMTLEDGKVIRGEHLVGQSGAVSGSKSKFSRKHFEKTLGLYNDKEELPTYENYLTQLGFYQRGHNAGGMIQHLIGGGGVQALRSWMSGNYDQMREAASRRTIMSLKEPVEGTFHRGTQRNQLPKHIQKLLNEAERTGDYSKLIGQEFSIRPSSWTTSRKSARLFSDIGGDTNRVNALYSEKSLITKLLEEDILKFNNPSTLQSVRNPEFGLSLEESIIYGKRRIAEIDRELESIGNVSPLLLSTKGKFDAVPASKIIKDAKYLGKPVKEGEFIFGNKFQISKASNGKLTLVPVQKRNLGGMIQYRNPGGPIFDSTKTNRTIVPGVGNTDTVPAILTPGEFVVNKQATAQNKGLLSAINNGMNIGGMIPKYAAGGLVEAGVDSTGKKIYRNARGEIVYGNNRPVPTQRIPAQTQKTSTPVTGVGGGRAMGVSMGLGALGGAMMMAPMVMPGLQGNAGASGLLAGGGMALSMASMLPMLGLNPPAMIAIGAVATAAAITAASLYAWRKSIDDSAKKNADLGAAVGGTANALNTMAQVLGTLTPAQSQMMQEMKFSADEAQKFGEFQQALQSEAGQKLMADLKSKTTSERVKQLTDYTSSAVASGMMDKESAQTFAKTVGIMLSDAVVGTAVSKAIADQKTGSSALLEKANKRLEEVSKTKAISEIVNAPALGKEGYQKSIATDVSAYAIGSALQVVQDYSNVIAVAKQEYEKGTISLEDYNKTIEEATRIQNQYATIVSKAVGTAVDVQGARQALDTQLLAGGMSQEQLDALTHATDIGISTLFGIGQNGQSAYISDYVTKKAREQGVAESQLSATQRQEFLNEAKQAQDAASKMFENGLNEDLKLMVVSGKATAEQAAALGAELMNNSLSAAAKQYQKMQAEGKGILGLDQAVFMNNIENDIIAGLDEVAKGKVIEVGLKFSEEGINLAELTTFLNQLPEEKRVNFTTKVLGDLTADELQILLGVSPEVATSEIVTDILALKKDFVPPVATEAKQTRTTTTTKTQRTIQQYPNTPGVSQSTTSEQGWGMAPTHQRTKTLKPTWGMGYQGLTGTGTEGKPIITTETNTKTSTIPVQSVRKGMEAVGIIEATQKEIRDYNKILEDAAKGVDELSQLVGSENASNLLQGIDVGTTKESANAAILEIKRVTDSVKQILSLPQDIQLRLNVDMTDRKQVEEVAKASEKIVIMWPILENLDPEIDLKLFAKFLLEDEEGRPLTAKQTYEKTKALQNAWSKFKNAKNETVRKTAFIELIEMQNGKKLTDKEKGDAGKRWDEMVKKFGKDVIVKASKKSLIAYYNLDVKFTGLKESRKRLVDALAAMKTDDPEARKMLRNQIAAIDQLMGDQTAQAEADVYGSALGNTGTTTGGGGSGQKSIAQQLKDQLKNLDTIFQSIKNILQGKNKDFKNLMAGPFAPEFIEYLKSQGEEGLKILKQGGTKFTQAYNDFVKIQLKTARNYRQQLPIIFNEQAQQAMGENRLRRKLAKEGLSQSATETYLQGMPAGFAGDYNRAYMRRQKLAKGKDFDKLSKKQQKAIMKRLTPEEKQLLELGEPTPRILKTAEKATYEVSAGALATAKAALDTKQAFIDMGYTPDIAQKLTDMGISADYSKDKIQKLVDAIKEIDAATAFANLNAQLDPTKLKTVADLMSMEPKMPRELAQIISESGITAEQAAPKLDEYISKWDQMQVAMYAAMDPLERANVALDYQIQILDLKKEIAMTETVKPLQDEMNILQDQVDAYSRKIELKNREIQKIDDAISKLNEEKDKITKAYDERLKALDEIEKSNERINRLQQGQLNIAQALSRGDVAAAAQAAMELQQTMAENRQQDTRDALENARQMQLEAIDKRINTLTEQRKIKEAEVKQYQEEQLILQDQIYTKQQLIKVKTDEINSTYDSSNQRLLTMKNNLQSIENQWINIQRQIAEANKLAGAQASTPTTTPTTTAPALEGTPVVQNANGTYTVYAMGTAMTFKWDSAQNKWVPVNKGGFIKKYAMGGRINKFAMGSIVPGTGMTDKVPALLTPGEFVIRKPVAEALGPILESINGNVFPKMNLTAPGIGLQNNPGHSPVQYNYEVNVNVADTDASPDQIANAVMSKIKMMEDRKLRSYRY